MRSQTSEPCIDPRTSDGVTELEALIQYRLSGQVRNFRLEIAHDGVVLRGNARTYYAKQLAQEALMSATALPILANEIEVGFARREDI
jgi:hypothetical protein